MLYKAIKQIYKKNLFTHLKYVKFFCYFNNYIKIFLIFLNNFFIELMNSIILKRKKINFTKKNLLIANFPRDWDLQSLSYKFLGKYTSIFSILVSTKNKFKFFKIFSLYERFKILYIGIIIKPHDILKFIIIPLCIFDNNKKKKKKYWLNFIKMKLSI